MWVGQLASPAALGFLPSRLSRLPRNRRPLRGRHVLHPCSGASFPASTPKRNGSRIFSVLCHFQKGQSVSDWEVSSRLDGVMMSPASAFPNSKYPAQLLGYAVADEFPALAIGIRRRVEVMIPQRNVCFTQSNRQWQIWMPACLRLRVLRLG